MAETTPSTKSLDWVLNCKQGVRHTEGGCKVGESCELKRRKIRGGEGRHCCR